MLIVKLVVGLRFPSKTWLRTASSPISLPLVIALTNKAVSEGGELIESSIKIPLENCKSYQWSVSLSPIWMKIVLPKDSAEHEESNGTIENRPIQAETILILKN